MALYVVASILNFICWAIGSQWRDWQRGVANSKVDESDSSVHDGLKGG